METIQCILERRSVRKFKREKLSAGVVAELINAARFAPTWANTRTSRYYLVADDTVRMKIAACCTDHNRKIAEGAPNLLVMTAVAGRSGMEGREVPSYNTHSSKEWTMFDSGIAAQTLCLAAHDMGIGSVIMGGYDIQAISRLLDVPEEEFLVAVIAAGYPDEQPAAPRRREVQEILRTV